MRVKVGDLFLETDSIFSYKWDTTLRGEPNELLITSTDDSVIMLKGSKATALYNFLEKNSKELDVENADNGIAESVAPH